jgi:hypothetical protein
VDDDKSLDEPKTIQTMDQFSQLFKLTWGTCPVT